MQGGTCAGAWSLLVDSLPVSLTGRVCQARYYASVGG